MSIYVPCGVNVLRQHGSPGRNSKVTERDSNLPERDPTCKLPKEVRGV